MTNDKIIITGARQNNLKNINLEIPRNKFVVITGLSGSGKSSLAFDTIYAEGQRRYVESLSSYARLFLGQMDKPDVDNIQGLSPAVSIDQKSTSRNPRSTVGTVTEVYDYMRLFWARIGKPHCPKCGKAISVQSVDQITDTIRSYPDGTKLQILAPLIRGKKGQNIKLFEELESDGFVRVRVDGKVFNLTEETEIISAEDKNKKHNVELLVDRIVLKEGIDKRLSESVELALKKGNGLIIADIIGDREILMSENYVCAECGYVLEEVAPRLFSFNSPFGACPECNGLGYHLELDPDLIIPNKKLSINQGAVMNFPGLNGDWIQNILKAVSESYGFDFDTPVCEFTEKQYKAIMYGVPEKIPIVWTPKSSERGYSFNANWLGLYGTIKKRMDQRAEGDELFDAFISHKECSSCKGKRLKPEALCVYVENRSISDICDMSVSEAYNWFASLSLSGRDRIIAERVIKEIRERLKFLCDVGLDYLTLSRAAATLSGGEAQRIRLATQIGSGLTGVLYVLDEPSIGLHQRDNSKLIETLKHLRDLGNTIVVVEHDEETMLESDYIIDIGPKAGEFGGEVVFAGLPKDLVNCEKSLIGAYLSGREKIDVPIIRREGNGNFLVLKGARENNLKNVTAEFPLGKFICVTGVSGSGKSSLIQETLFPKLQVELNRAQKTWGRHDEILGMEYLDKVINIDQSPIGRTPRSNPATYTGVFDLIRKLYAETPDAKVRGYDQGRFSFNKKGGRCEACAGDGIIKIEMHFLPDVYVPCEVCGGKRYNRETLKVRYKGKTISDVLNMTIGEATKFFENVPKIKNKLQTICDVGLDYIKMGQSATTLSGGEAQRMKLAAELSSRSTGRTIYILDEPTTGLHFHDVRKLISILNKLADTGNTVLVIEHNLDVIKSADYIIDMGPEGGSGGGRIIAQGTPEEVADNPKSYTGQYLKKVLGKK
ncbi:MAG: excinuclease ABC subunit UvrA [Armatimonadetes bacterium]|nr:excinuclease ABC subunit UvrA [Candidatus Hippobium faecium]